MDVSLTAQVSQYKGMSRDRDMNNRISNAVWSYGSVLFLTAPHPTSGGEAMDDLVGKLYILLLSTSFGVPFTTKL